MPILILFFLGLLSYFTPFPFHSTSAALVTTVPETQQKPIRILLVGDIMLDRWVQKKIKEVGKGNYEFPFLKVKNYLQSFDLIVGNLEGPISNRGEKVGSVYSFRMNPKAALALAEVNIKVVSLANNHIWDYGSVAFGDTLKSLNKWGVSYIGAGLNEQEAYSPTIVEIKDTKVGFLGFTEFLPHLEANGDKAGVAYLNKEKFRKAIKAAKAQVDILIVTFHWGAEYKKEPSANQKYWAGQAIDLGADLVFGHHPHIIQAVETRRLTRTEPRTTPPLRKKERGVRGKRGLTGIETPIKEKYIFYSLGNFVFDQSFSAETMIPGLVEIEIENKAIKKVNLRKAKLNKNFQVEL